ncbi:MAG: hypothetical protein KJ621_13490 [Proteobacteria bacterium]|nr:hypothetical protein [Pseudomonadota bacterium]MBU1742830.1 hypothetical protein [Pseudomonadota bacterium]
MGSEDLDRFLAELGRRVNGDPARNVDMWAVGEGLNLDRGDTESTATRLMGQGYLEVRTLSGAVGLTAAGVERLTSLAAVSPAKDDTGPSWPEVVARLEAAGRDLGFEATARSDFLADLGCLKLQLAKDRPHPGVLSACAESLRQALAPFEGQTDELLDQLAVL